MILPENVCLLTYDTDKDFLLYFTEIDRTRLFDDTWKVTSAWVSEAVEWENTFSKNRFEIQVPQKGKHVLVLQQLDDRYFRGLSSSLQLRNCYIDTHV